MNEKANYGNWVPEKALYMLFGAAVVLGAIAVIVQVVLSKPVITAAAGVLCVLALIMAVYMLICHETFAFGKGNMMAGMSTWSSILTGTGKADCSTLDAGQPHLRFAVPKLFQKHRSPQWTIGAQNGITPKNSVKKMHR